LRNRRKEQVMPESAEAGDRDQAGRTADRCPHPFDADTAVVPAGPDRYAARVTDRWTTPTGYPNGGYLLAICVRALSAALPLPDPLVVSAHFLRPGQAGQAGAVTTELIRTGQRHATAQARLSQGGKEIISAVGTYTTLRDEDSTVTDLRPPRLPPPDEVIDVALRGTPIADRVEYRAPQRPGWMDGKPSGRAHTEFWMRLSGGREPDLTALTFLVDAAAPAVFELGKAIAATVELSVYLRARPAPGWLACRMHTSHVAGGYCEQDMELWDSAGRLVAQSRQLALLA
jgi:acyl-CoA thioesterase